MLLAYHLPSPPLRAHLSVHAVVQDVREAQVAVLPAMLPTLSLNALCTQIDVGARQLRRITEHTHGLSPKALAMKYRALRTAHAFTLGLGDMQHPLVTQALLAYADQSHAIHDFQRFIGWTPAAFGSASISIARATLAGRHGAGVRRLTNSALSRDPCR